MLSSAVAVAATGPSRFSLDRAIGWDGSISGLWWGVGVLAVAVLPWRVTLASRRVAKPRLREAPQSEHDRRRAA